MNTIELQTIVFIQERLMFDAKKPFQFHLDIGSTDENYWQLAYKLKLELWFYILYEDLNQVEQIQKTLLLPSLAQLVYFIQSDVLDPKSIYMLSPSYVNKSSIWKLHKIFKVRVAQSKVSDDTIFQCLLEGNYSYTNFPCDEYDRDALEYETVYADTADL